ncbi:MAG: FkbM family methyltransferase [Ignavibacteriaceae bacterium]|nr:FkbM family methyltransferase [Ignavibacteriaceae bacterium]
MGLIRNRTRKLFSKLGYGVTKYPHPRDRRKLNQFKLKKIDLILDIGANKGQFADYIRGIGFEGDIISFEPLRTEFEILKNAADSDPKWECENFAFGDFDGTAEINIANNSSSSSLMNMSESHILGAPGSFFVDKQNIEVKRLDTYLNQTKVIENKNTFVKIDVQGFERKVIDGASDYLKKFTGIQLELSFIELYEGETTFGEFLEIMKQNNYFPAFIEPCLIDSRTGKLLQVDVMFFNSTVN